MTLSEALNKWLVERIIPSHPADNTLRVYENSVKVLSRQFGAVPIAALTQPRINQMLARITGMPRTIRLHHVALAGALDHAIASGHLPPGNPARGARLPKVQRLGKVKRLDETDLSVILARCHLDPVWGPLVRLLLTTGLRRHELCNLKWGHWDWTRKGFDVVKSKSGAGLRFVTVPDSVLDEFFTMAQGQPADAYVAQGATGGRLNPDILGRKVKALIETSGVAGRWTTHSLRHTHASILVERGRSLPDIARRLGHSSPRVTMDIYAHPAAKGDAALAAEMESIL